MSEPSLVLCGPIVRRVEPDAASVFVATRAPCEVALTVYDQHEGSTGAPLMRGTRETIALGPGVHAAVVTARAPNALAWGRRYHYDVAFTVDGAPRAMADDGVLVPSWVISRRVDRLVYPGQDRPGFALPPTDPAELRILHGSCRKPHGAGVDALAHADRLIRDALDGEDVLPHQLFLTGDQIYADDVHADVLGALRAFAHAAVGRAEEDADLAAYADQLAPGRRVALCEQVAKLSTGSRSSHLITLGEFYAMYLHAWSLEPWRGAEADTARLATGEFVKSLPAVRRMLANVPTFMVFDDHEVTDDWYIRRGWSDRVLGNPIGRKIIRNGLAAYLVFQHWGNDPDAFASDRPGGRALAAIDGWDGADSGASVLNRILPVPSSGAQLAVPSDERVDYSWRWRSPSYDVVAFDTRTRRRFDANGVSLLTEDGVDAALGDEADGLFTIALSAVPVLGVALLEWGQQLAEIKLDDEPWAHGKVYEHLLARLLERWPVIVLSGDVHFGFGSSLYDKHSPADRVVNFVSSALKNQPSKQQRLALWALGFQSDNALQSAAERRLDGLPLIVPIHAERSVNGRALAERVLVDSADAVALIPGALDANEPAEELQGASSKDRTDIAGRCNLGDIRFYPDRNEVVQVLWCKHDSWRANRQKARFWLR